MCILPQFEKLGDRKILSKHVLSYTACINQGGTLRGDHLTQFLEIREELSWGVLQRVSQEESSEVLSGAEGSLSKLTHLLADKRS